MKLFFCIKLNDMKQFPPNMNPEIFTITGIIVGLILEDDYTSDELNSIGNWLILVGQIVLTTAAQQQLINNRYQGNSGSRIRSDANNHANANPVLARQSDIDNLMKRVSDLENSNRS